MCLASENAIFDGGRKPRKKKKKKVGKPIGDPVRGRDAPISGGLIVGWRASGPVMQPYNN